MMHHISTQDRTHGEVVENRMIRKEEIRGDDACILAYQNPVYSLFIHNAINGTSLIAVAVAPSSLTQLTLQGGDHPLRAGFLCSFLLIIFCGCLSGLLGLFRGALFLILHEVDVTISVLDCLVVLKCGLVGGPT